MTKSLGQIAYEAYSRELHKGGKPQYGAVWETVAEAAVHHYIQHMELTPPLAASSIDAGLDYFNGHPRLNWCPHCRSYSEGSCRCYDDDEEALEEVKHD